MFDFISLNRIRHNAAHYDTITEAWKHIFGDSFHFGYFPDDGVSLDQATDLLIEKMASMADIGESTHLLDVGCGIGSPAFFLHRKFGCSITGITTSPKGVEEARLECQHRGYQENVRFEVRDALENGFEDESFDIAWVMESSHLMKDKAKLFRECYRVIKPGGTIVLCDIMLKRPFGFADLFGYLWRMKLGYITSSLSIIKAFGRTRIETFDLYRTGLQKVGFENVQLVDISRETMPTFEGWKSNIASKVASIEKSFDSRQIEDFLTATDLTHDFFERQIAGYAILSAIKR